MMMMSDPNGRPRPRSLAEDQNVKQARNRFKNVLKHMVQDNFLQDEEDDSEDDSENEENRLHLGGSRGNYRMGGGNTSLNVGGRKRKHSGDVDDLGGLGGLGGGVKPQASFVMKLFDRGVDLAQFDETTPLYPICRAWMQNKPHQRQPKRGDDDGDSTTSELEYQGETEEVYRLPGPEPLPYDEYGALIRVRVPPLLPREGAGDDFDINYEDDSAPSPAYLFQTHLDRWNLIRQRWKEASAYNEKRFDGSFNILRQIHERVTQHHQQQQQQNVAVAAAAAAAQAQLQQAQQQAQQNQ